MWTYCDLFCVTTLAFTYVLSGSVTVTCRVFLWFHQKIELFESDKDYDLYSLGRGVHCRMVFSCVGSVPDSKWLIIKRSYKKRALTKTGLGLAFSHNVLSALTSCLYHWLENCSLVSLPGLWSHSTLYFVFHTWIVLTLASVLNQSRVC